MLDAHPDMAIPPETGFLALVAPPSGMGLADHNGFLSAVTGFPPDASGWHDFGIPAERFRSELSRIEPFDIAEGFRAFYRLYADRMKKPRWGDKTPAYVHHIQTIHGLLPEARFIHIIRDGRDACLSWRRTWFRPGDDIRTLALHWRGWVLTGRQQGTRCPAYMEIRYEHLIADTRRTLESICRFVNLEFHPAMMRYYERAPERLKEHRERRLPDGVVLVTHEQRLRNQESATRPPNPARVLAWRLSMTPEEQREFARYAGDALRMFGYEC